MLKDYTFNAPRSDASRFCAPLYASLLKYAQDNPARFHMPGHKGGELSPLFSVFGGALGFDVTELPETDNLFEDEGAILEAERLASRFYGTRETLFSAGGSTMCIQAMLRLVSARRHARAGGGKVICARNIHKAVVSAMALLDIEPVFVWNHKFEGSGMPGVILPEDIEAAASQYRDAVAVFLTSPDYYGVMSDIPSISAVCRRHGLPLLVDNAHGAHLCCLDRALHPIAQGADMCCDSAHKTLPALTGGAFLQINSPEYFRSDAKDAMALFGSTSPSYLIMLSLDLARAWMEEDGAAAFTRLSEKVASLREKCASLGFFTPEKAVFDPVRITIDTASRGISGYDAALHLRRHGISPEMGDGRHLVLIPTPFNTDDDFARLEAALDSLETGSPLPIENKELEKPEIKMSLREAIMSPFETVETQNSAGKIAAEAKCPCPPCVPLVMPGELISSKMAISLKSYGVLNIKVVK
jgi:arginine decarboxylase